MRIKWQGEDLGDFNGQPRIKEARQIKTELGMLPKEFGEALNANDPDAVAMLVSIMLARRSGEPVNWRDLDGEFDDFETELSDQELVEINKALKERDLDPVGKDGKPVLPGAASSGSSGNGAANPPLTWTGPSEATPSSSGPTSG